jgi:hypothetical protein
MPKIVLVVLIGAAVAAACVLLMWSTGGASIFGRAEHDEVAVEQGKELTAPSLHGVPGTPRDRTPRVDPDQIPRARTGDELVLRVRVVDDETGQPVAGATIVRVHAQGTCPDFSTVEYALLDEGSKPGEPRRTDAEGILAIPEAGQDAGREDVYAHAAGYVIGTTCGALVPGEVTVRLKKGLTLRGKVTDPRGKRLSGGYVTAEPGEGTPAVAGHVGRSGTDDKGQFAIDGLLAGALKVTVHAPGHWPLTVPAEDPTDDRERTYVLQPAYTFKFRLRTNDGREIVNPTLQANAPLAKPPFQHLGILKLLDDKTAEGSLTEGVMVPAALGTVALEIKSEGYAAWRAPTQPVPPEGGEITIPVVLDRDSGQGGLRFTFEDERGKRLKYTELRALPPTIMALERQDLAGGIVYELREDLRFPSLPPGKYRFGIRAFAYAPQTIDTVVVGGVESEFRVAFRAAARLRVKFTAPTARMVRFQITQNGRPVPALPETEAPKEAETPLTEDPTLSAGAEGALLGGLASGTYVIEVLSEDLLPSRTSVTVREGETEEVEIRVTPR